jgi:ribosomal protein S18 acetylase RimI-like enzyme
MSSELSIVEMDNNLSNQYTLYKLLVRLDEFYIPRISSRVDLKKYSVKLLLSGKVFCVVTSTGKHVGLLAIYVNDVVNHHSFISSIGILPEYHSTRVSKDLILVAFDVAIKYGMKSIFLEVDTSNFRALAFYKKHGFIEVRRTDNIILMTKKLIG